jgi:hypothetical protein
MHHLCKSPTYTWPPRSSSISFLSFYNNPQHLNHFSQNNCYHILQYVRAVNTFTHSTTLRNLNMHGFIPASALALASMAMAMQLEIGNIAGQPTTMVTVTVSTPSAAVYIGQNTTDSATEATTRLSDPGRTTPKLRYRFWQLSFKHSDCQLSVWTSSSSPPSSSSSASFQLSAWTPSSSSSSSPSQLSAWTSSSYQLSAWTSSSYQLSAWASYSYQLSAEAAASLPDPRRTNSEPWYRSWQLPFQRSCSP